MRIEHMIVSFFDKEKEGEIFVLQSQFLRYRLILLIVDVGRLSVIFGLWSAISFQREKQKNNYLANDFR